MKNSFIKVVIPMLIFIFFASGCYGQTEIENLGIVRITGIDWDNKTDQYEVTVATIRPMRSPGAATGIMAQGEQQISWVTSAKGESIFDAIKNLRSRASSNLSWLHSTVIIIGNDMAKKGVNEFIDFFARNREIRYTSYVFISKGKAKDILKLTPEESSSLSQEIEGIIKNNQEWGKTYIPTLKDFLITLVYKDYDSLLGLIKPVKPEPFERQEVEEVAGRKASDKVVALEGSAVIKNHSLRDFMNRLETRGYLWITGDISRTVVDIKNKDNKTSIEIEAVVNENKLKLENNNLKINIDVKARGHILETTQSNYISKEGIQKLQKRASEKINNEIIKTIEKNKDLKTDIFGFGRQLYREQPDKWEKVKNNWNEIFSHSRVKVNTKISIKSIGLTSKPISEGE